MSACDAATLAEIRACNSIQLEAWICADTELLEIVEDEQNREWLTRRITALKEHYRRRERMTGPIAPLRVATTRIDLDRIKRDFSVDLVVSRLAAVELRSVGSRLLAVCPFPDHRDSTPSFTVHRDGSRWRCYGCGRSGDIFSFAQYWFDAHSFVGAVDLLVAAMGSRLDEYRQDGPQPRGGAIRVA